MHWFSHAHCMFTKSITLAEIFMAGWTQEMLELALLSKKSNLIDALGTPTGFQKVWTGEGSGERHDVMFYKPICPSIFRTLGHAKACHHQIPFISCSLQYNIYDIWCVKSEYVHEILCGMIGEVVPMMMCLFITQLQVQIVRLSGWCHVAVTVVWAALLTSSSQSMCGLNIFI